MKKIRIGLAALAVMVLTAGCGAGKTSPAAAGQTESVSTEQGSAEGTEQKEGLAAGDETISQNDVGEESMTPVYGTDLKDGVYPVEVDSSSSMFRITECSLTVQDGRMEAVMTMGGTGYLKLFMGTGEEAVKAGEDQMIPYEEGEDGVHRFTVPVEALNQKIACSAFSKNKEKWYDRTLVFRADSLPLDAFVSGVMKTAESLGLEDGQYTAEVTLEGGSGRAKLQSPASLRVENGNIYARIVWDSSNYDYMKVDEARYDRISGQEHSEFEIPVAGFDWKLPVIADTVAMSQPHEISYTLEFDSASLKKASEEENADPSQSGSMDLSYAEQFSVQYQEDGSRLIHINESGDFLVVPEGGQAPEKLPAQTTVLYQPLEHVYLAATSAMDFIRTLDVMDQVTLSGTEASGWYIDEAKKAMESGWMTYAGKYSAPDYELILSQNCGLAIESTMIYHSPEVKEQLERLGIPVLVERSSYESSPLGRMEWMKLYGVLFGREQEAEQLFERQISQLKVLENQTSTGKTAAFFYVNSNGAVNVRKSNDYVAKMIGMAGGVYVPKQLSEEDNALSTMNMQMEAFYAAAKDADYLIYNSAIDGELKSLDEFLKKSPLFQDFKAVKEGHVWCTGKNMFQETMGVGDMILDMHRIFTEEEPDEREMRYLHRLR